MDGADCTNPGAPALLPGYIVPLAEAYRRLPRRVGPWIDRAEFIDGTHEQGTHEPLALPRPPAALAALHDDARVRALVRRLDERLAAAIDRPAVVHRHSQRGRRAVVVLFSAVVELHGPQVLQTLFVPNDEPMPRWSEATLPCCADPLPFARFSLDPAPWLDLWMDRYLAVVGYWLGTLVPLHPTLASRYLAWLRGQMLRRHWSPPTRRAVRAAVARALALDAQALQLAARIRCLPRQGGAVTADRYALALAHRAALLEVQRVASTLVPLYGLVARALHPALYPAGQPLQALRQWVLADVRLKPRHWRWLQRHGTRWLWRAMACLRSASPLEVRELLVLGCSFGFEGRLSTPLLMAVVNVWANANRPGVVTREWADPFLVRPLAQWWRRCPVAQRPALEALAPALANWLCSAANDQTLPQLLRIGWRRAAAQMRDDERQCSQQWLDDTPCVRPLALDAVRHGALRVRGLDSPAAIWAESRAMRHCADRYIDRVRGGGYRMFSIFHARTGRRVATLLLEREPTGWQVSRLSGFANRQVAPAVWQIAQATCAALADEPHA